MENKFKKGDVITFKQWDIPESHDIRKIWGHLFIPNKEYTVGLIGTFNWGHGKGLEACIRIDEIYGGWIPESIFISIETHYLIHN